MPAAAIADEIKKTDAIDRQEQIGYAAVDGFDASTTRSVQETGSGKVLGISSTYAAAFPGQIRLLQGAFGGTLLAQQTASNLHAGLGDTVTVLRAGLPSVKVVVSGIVDLPNVDMLFQAIGSTGGTRPRRPRQCDADTPEPVERAVPSTSRAAARNGALADPRIDQEDKPAC